jgi:hypothetical protein
MAISSVDNPLVLDNLFEYILQNPDAGSLKDPPKSETEQEIPSSIFEDSLGSSNNSKLEIMTNETR